MAIETVQAYQCRCGRCEIGYRTDGLESAGVPLVPMVWKIEENLMDWLTNDESWHHIEDDWYCHECVMWNEDESELIVKPK